MPSREAQMFLYDATALFSASGYEDLLLDNVGGYVNDFKT